MQSHELIKNPYCLLLHVEKGVNGDNHDPVKQKRVHKYTVATDRVSSHSGDYDKINILQTTEGTTFTLDMFEKQLARETETLMAIIKHS